MMPFTDSSLITLFSYSLNFCDYFFGNVFWRLLVSLKMHSRGGAALSRRSQVSRITKHLRKRHKRCNNLGAADAWLHALNLPAPRIQIAIDCAGVVVRCNNFHTHDRLKQHRFGFPQRILECQRTRDVKRTLVGIHFVIGTKHQAHPYVDHFIARKEAALHRVLDSLLHRLDVLARYRAASNLVFENKTFARRGLDLNFDVAKLAATTSLFLVDFLTGGGLSNRLAVSNLRLAHIRFHAKFSLHAIDNDLEMKLTHAGNNCLPGFMIGCDRKRGILLGQPVQRQTKLVLILSRLWFHGVPVNRRRKLHSLKNDRLVVVADRVTGCNLLHSADGNNLARARIADIFALVGVHAHQATDALFRVFDWVVSVGTRFDRAAVNSHERQLPEMLVGHYLENKTSEWRVGVRWATFKLSGLRIDAFHRRNVERRW